MIDEKQLEEIRAQFGKILENENFTPDEEYGKELEEFINMNFSEDFENEVNQKTSNLHPIPIRVF
jgi:ribosome-binding protein aMBF1 (putative translation factor)